MKKSLLLLVLLFGLLEMGCESMLAKKIAVKGLRCEYRINPLGIDIRQPRLSWILESAQRNQKQTAYRILVAGNPDLLQKNLGDLWDSGQVKSDQSAQLKYQGQPLSSLMPCYWKVQVWDQQGEVSDWSEPACWTMGLLEKTDWQAHWIGGHIPPDKPAGIEYPPAVYLRKEFTPEKALRRATVYSTALGLYELYINGQRVGADYFTPGWTQYDKRVYYQAYDVTDLIQPKQANAFGAILGEGWYGLRHAGRWKERLMIQLEMEFTDGTRQFIGTDDSWKVTDQGPIRSSDMFDGEYYDARRELPGWNTVGYNDAAWKPAVCDKVKELPWIDVTEKFKNAVQDNSLSITASNGNFGDPAFGVVKSLQVQYRLGEESKSAEIAENQTFEVRGTSSGPKLEIIQARYGAEIAVPADNAIMTSHPGVPVRKIMEIKPVAVSEPKPAQYVFNMGQNMVGWVRLKVKGQAGTKVVLRFAEMLNPDGTIYTENLRAARCTDSYTLKGTGEEIWEPRFTFHGFQYVEITGLSKKPDLGILTGVVLASDCPVTGFFECSNPMLNKLYHNIVWGQRGNYLEVPTDCPQRDERMGWTGDAQVFIRTGAYNMDIGAFFTSWLNTLNDCQLDNGSYTDVAPCYWGGGVAGWGDAGIICPWTLYQVYNDTAIIENHYETMARWIEYLKVNSQNLLRPDFGYGDWLNVNAELPKDVIATAYFAYSTRRMAEMARAIGKEQDAQAYQTLFEQIKAAFQQAYVTADGRIKGDTQTAYAMALYFDLLPTELQAAAASHLIEKIQQRDWHLSTGFLGVNLLLPTLEKIGRLDAAWRLLTNDTYPSWGYSIKHGATTIWERWDGWTEDKGFQDPAMNSFNHYAYGSAGQWMFSTVAGIDTDGPGFQRLKIHPQPGGGLTYAKASYDSIQGKIATDWRLEDDHFQLSVTIPANTTATVLIPAQNEKDVTEGGQPAAQAEGVKFLRMENGTALYEVGSGTYRFISKH